MNQSFVHIEYPTRHQAIGRFEDVVGTVKSLRKGFDATRGLAGVLLAAMVSALVVVADQLMETWADEGHLLTAWVMLWVVGFAALALLAPTARRVAKRTTAGLDAWSRGVARRRADERLWELARKDPRIMADLSAARSRAETVEVAEVTGATARKDALESVRPACYVSYM